jgi:hypothetical protein
LTVSGRCTIVALGYDALDGTHILRRTAAAAALMNVKNGTDKFPEILHQDEEKKDFRS